jgi:hypothetical protein
MHQQPTHRVHAEPAIRVLAAVHPDGLADLLGVLALEGELGGVLNDQDGTRGRGDTLACRIEVPGEDVAFTHPVVGEEPVGRLGVGPVLACQRDAAAHRPGHLVKQCAQTAAQPFVGEAAAGKFIVNPCA